MSKDAEKIIKSNPAFCVLPWIHIHVMPDSSVIPCCVSPYDEIYGDVSKESIDSIWNNSKYRELRSQMLRGEKPAGCEQCHKQECAGFSSMRTSVNQRFVNQIPQFVKETHKDGT